jgi:uncharacterized membrane protein
MRFSSKGATMSSVVKAPAATAAGSALASDRGLRPTARIGSVDFVRGVVMTLMAIDHVRVYSGVPAGGPTPGIFFTRWITHFVAPAFVFLAGTAAYLHGRKLNNPAALSKFLLTRGLWLVFLELTVLRVAWTFNFDFSHYMLAGVIWMIGWCMVAMALLSRAPVLVNAIAGVAIIALHNITDLFRPQLMRIYADHDPNWFLKLLYFGGAVKLGPSGPPLLILYVLVPWIGVMMAGYAFGAVMTMSADRRRSICLKLGAGLMIAFVVLRAFDVYGDPRPWRTAKPAASTQAASSAAPANGSPSSSAAAPRRPEMPAVLAFLNTTKYPASLSFLLMTLGPMFLLLGLAEGLSGKFSGIVNTFGRVPMFYYLLHIPLIHAAACAVSLVREGHINAWLFANHPLAPGRAPEGYMWSLGLLYLVWTVCVIVLYFPCRWFAKLRARRASPWLSYL